MKRILLLLLCLVFVLSLIVTGCGSPQTSSNKPQDEASENEPSNETNTEEVVDDDGRAMEGNMYLEGFPIVKDKVTLKFFAPHNTAVEDYYTNYFVTMYEEMTNVHIEWELIPPSGLAEKKNLIFASDDLPDVFFGAGISFEEAVMYGSQGLLRPINDLIEKYNPELQTMFARVPNLEKILTAPDGNIYQFPSQSDCYHCSYPRKAWINVEWLKNVDMEIPETTDEFYAVLKAFKDEDANGNGDPNDEIPFSAAENSWSSWPIDWIMNAFIYEDRGTHLVIQDGKVSLSANQPEYKEGLKFINKLYSEGLMDPESFTQDFDMLVQKMKNPDISIVGAAPCMHYLGLVGVTGDRPDEYDVIPPLIGPNGHQSAYYNPYQIDPGKYVITTKCEYPEVAARWVDWFYTEEGLLAQKYGRENEEWYTPAPDSGEMGHGEGLEPAPARFNWMPGKSWSETLQNITLNQQGPINETREFRGAWTNDPASPLEPRLIEATKKYEGTAMEEFWPPVMMTQEETDEIRPLQTQINGFIHEMGARFVTGETDIDEGWDNYLKTLEDMGLARYLEIRQQVYDRFLSN